MPRLGATAAALAVVDADEVATRAVVVVVSTVVVVVVVLLAFPRVAVGDVVVVDVVLVVLLAFPRVGADVNFVAGAAVAAADDRTVSGSDEVVLVTGGGLEAGDLRDDGRRVVTVDRVEAAEEDVVDDDVAPDDAEAAVDGSVVGASVVSLAAVVIEGRRRRCDPTPPSPSVASEALRAFGAAVVAFCTRAEAAVALGARVEAAAVLR